MIVDTLNQGEFYALGPAWEMALEFLRGLDADHEDGKVELQGDEIFARIMSYDTQGPEESVIESHEVYVDIQMPLRGAEGIDWWPREDLTIKQGYDELRDVAYYEPPAVCPARVDLQVGTFAVLFPNDAHRPKQIVGGAAERIKKVVVKVKKELLMNSLLEA